MLPKNSASLRVGERMQNTRHLTSMLVTFSDSLKKYSKSNDFSFCGSQFSLLMNNILVWRVKLLDEMLDLYSSPVPYA